MRQQDIVNFFWLDPFSFQQVRNLIFLRHLNWRPQTVKSITKFRLNIIVIASIIEQIALIPVLDKEHSCRESHLSILDTFKEQTGITRTISRWEILNAFDNLGHIVQSLLKY